MSVDASACGLFAVRLHGELILHRCTSTARVFAMTLTLILPPESLLHFAAINVRSCPPSRPICSARWQRQTVVIVEPPLNYKMVFDGPTNMGPARSSVNVTSMALFPHAPGASVCAPLYEHYVAEDGLCYHL